MKGRTIANVRRMTAEEMEREGWRQDAHGRPFLLVLDDGTTLFPSRDEEGNGAGALFGCSGDGAPFYVGFDTP